MILSCTVKDCRRIVNIRVLYQVLYKDFPRRVNSRVFYRVLYKDCLKSVSDYLIMFCTEF